MISANVRAAVHLTHDCC